MVLLRTVAVVSTSTRLTEPEPAPAAPTPLPDCLTTASANTPAAVNALMLWDEVALTVSVPLESGSHSMLLDSIRAMLSVVMRLTAIATPAESAAAELELPCAAATERLPAMAKIVDLSLAQTRTSLASASESSATGAMVAVESIMRALVSPLTSLYATEPASDPATEDPAPAPEFPDAKAPAPPAARVQIFDALSALTDKR